METVKEETWVLTDTSNAKDYVVVGDASAVAEKIYVLREHYGRGPMRRLAEGQYHRLNGAKPYLDCLADVAGVVYRRKGEPADGRGLVSSWHFSGGDLSAAIRVDGSLGEATDALCKAFSESQWVDMLIEAKKWLCAASGSVSDYDESSWLLGICVANGITLAVTPSGRGE